MSKPLATACLAAWMGVVCGLGLLTGAEVGNTQSSSPVMESKGDLQDWLPDTHWKQVDANFRLVFGKEFVRRPRAKNKMPWKVIRADAVEVTAAKGKRLDTYRFHESYGWFTNDHKGQVFQFEKQKAEIPAQSPERSQTNLVSESTPTKAAAKPIPPTKDADPVPMESKTDSTDPLTLPYKIAGGIFVLPMAIGLLALLGALVRGSSNTTANSLRGDEAPTGNTLEDHSGNAGRLIGGLLLYGAGFAGLVAMVLNGPHGYVGNIAYPILALLLPLGFNLMFLRFHLVLSRNPKGLTKWWCVLSVPCEVRSIRGDQLQRIEVTRESHSSGSDSGSRRVSYSFPVKLKHELGTADLDCCNDFETARARGERIAKFMGLDLHASKDGKTKSRVSGNPDQSLRERIKAGTEKIEMRPRPENCRIQRNLENEDVVFELPPVAGRQERIYVSAKALRVEHGGEPFVVDSNRIAGLDVKDSHKTFEMLKEESGVDKSSEGTLGGFALKMAEKQYAKERDGAALVVFGDGVDHEFGYRLTAEDAHWLRASLCQILTS